MSLLSKRSEGSADPHRAKRTASLLFGFIGMAMAGTMYLFGSYSPELKSSNNYTATEMATIVALGDLGQYGAGPMGFFYDRFGSRATIWCSSLLVFGGYMLMYCGVAVFHNTPAMCMALFLMLVGQGSIGIYIGSLITNEKNFSAKHRGKVIGMCASFFGLSSAIFSRIHNSFFAHRPVQDFLLFLAIALTSVASTAAFFIRQYPLAASLRESDGHSSSKDVLLSTQQEVDVHGWALFRDPLFYAMFFAICTSTGPGLVFINNMGFVSKALDQPINTRDTVVTVFAVFNTCGRILIGILSDLLVKYVGRPFFLVTCAVLMCLCQAAMMFVDDRVFLVAAFGIGIAYGGLFATYPVLIREFFGQKHFGSNFGVLNVGPGLGIVCLSIPAAAIYQKKANNCTGSSCFFETFLFCACSAFLSVLIGLYVVWKARHRGSQTLLQPVGDDGEPGQRQVSSGRQDGEAASTEVSSEKEDTEDQV